MHGLLAIALTMYPMRIDESIHTQLREKYGDKMLRMQKGWAQLTDTGALMGATEWFDYYMSQGFSPETLGLVKEVLLLEHSAVCRRVKYDKIQHYFSYFTQLFILCEQNLSRYTTLNLLLVSFMIPPTLSACGKCVTDDSWLLLSLPPPETSRCLKSSSALPVPNSCPLWCPTTKTFTQTTTKNPSSNSSKCLQRRCNSRLSCLPSAGIADITFGAWHFFCLVIKFIWTASGKLHVTCVFYFCTFCWF